ncbi:MAG: hypothetical protein C0475_01835 [Planctomyces sp.]|nr:hypothetical protein [Planctomyces sp.]MBA4039254.1 hypothetical protein [Planctomyces sp.]MBA4119610.1 hypothetical protein [Isosphaera sp.]
MAGHQYLSKHQRGIVSRYYQHADARLVAQLQEIVSELFVESKAGQDAAAAKLWTRALAALRRAGVEGSRLDLIERSRDVSALAALVGELSAGPKP